MPILNYGVEVWGFNHSTPTDGIYAELGRYPFQKHHKIAMIKYLKRLVNLSDDELAKKAFNQQLQNDQKGHYN